MFICRRCVWCSRWSGNERDSRSETITFRRVGDERALRLKMEADNHAALPPRPRSAPLSAHSICYYHADYRSIRGETAQKHGGWGWVGGGPLNTSTSLMSEAPPLSEVKQVRRRRCCNSAAFKDAFVHKGTGGAGRGLALPPFQKAFSLGNAQTRFCSFTER